MDDYNELKDWLKDTETVPLEDMGAFFDARVGDYEDHMARWKEHYAWMARLLPGDAQTLLDIGCGTGLELDEIFKRFPALKVTGVDLSKEMLAQLKRKHGGRALIIIRDNYFTCPFGDGCFDAAVSFETLHHFAADKKQGLFRKIRDALKPGGVYLECDYIAVSQEIETLLLNEHAKRRARSGIAPDVFVHFDTPLTLEHETQAMRDAGFARVETIGFFTGRPSHGDDPRDAVRVTRPRACLGV